MPRSTVSVALGQRIRTRREALGLGLRECSRAGNVSAGYLSQIETGKAEPAVSSLLRIARMLNTTVGELTDGLEDLVDEPLSDGQ